VTSWETPGISVGLHANISLLRGRKSTNSLSYLGSKLAPICAILVGSLSSIWTALASLTTLIVPGIEGIAELSVIEGTQRLSSLSSAVATAATASSMLSYSQSSAHRVLASMVINPVGPGIFSLR
jgi:hypothetical protein